MEANQSQTSKTTNSAQTDKRAGNLLQTTLERIRSGEFKARLHYFLFQRTQQAKESDSLLSKYKRQLTAAWPKWLGLSMLLTALLLFSNGGKWWFWQLPLLAIFLLLMPLLFELPAAINSLFGNTEYQHLVGTTLHLETPIIDRQGEVHLDGRDWLISGPDCAVGQEVQIVTLDAKTLYVLPTRRQRVEL